MIEILSGPAPAGELPAIEVTCFSSPLGEAFAVARVCAYEREGATLTVREIVPACRMSLETATRAAELYAAQRGVPRIYVQTPPAATALADLRALAG